VHSFGIIEFLTRIPLSAQAGIMGDVINFILVTLVFGVLTYFIANFMIKKFKYATPGRLGNYEDGLGAEQAGKAADGQASAIASNASEQQIADVIYLLGGKENIDFVDACMTRLRVTVKDTEKVASDEYWKAAGAMGLMVRGTGVQAIYGPKSDILKSDINDLLDAGTAIPAPSDKITGKAASSEPAAVSEKSASSGQASPVFAPVAGQLLDISRVNDPVFSEKMMGDGYAVEPDTNAKTAKVYAPVAGKIVSIFPSHHAIGIQTSDDLEVLIHMGIDTNNFDPEIFGLKVAVDQEVTAGQELGEINLQAIEEAGKEKTVIVGVTNSESIDRIELANVDQQIAGGQEASKIHL